MSVRFGISGPSRRCADHLGELVEQVVRVVRARVGLGVVLDAERRSPVTCSPSHTPSLRLTWVIVAASPSESALDGEVVVLARDLDAVGQQVLDRVVPAVVAERQLDGARPDRRPSNWWPRQIPKIGTLPSSRGSSRRRTATSPDRRAVRQEHAVGLAGEDVAAASVSARTTSTAPSRARLFGDVALHAEVDRHDPSAARRVERGDRVVVRRRHRGDEVDAVGARLGLGGRPQLGLGDRAERPGHRAGVAQQAGQPAGVDPADPGHAVRGEHRAEVAVGAEVAVPARELATRSRRGRTSPATRSRSR